MDVNTIDGNNNIRHSITLPIDIRPIYDDRVERPESTEATVTNRDHPCDGRRRRRVVAARLRLNQVTGLRDDANELVTVDGHSLFAVSNHGQGRGLSTRRIPRIQWGLDLVDWAAYDEFWLDAIAWAAGE